MKDSLLLLQGPCIGQADATRAAAEKIFPTPSSRSGCGDVSDGRDCRDCDCSYTSVMTTATTLPQSPSCHSSPLQSHSYHAE